MSTEPTSLQTCSNCKKEISSANFATHSAYCYRHNTVCPKCNETVGKRELQQHNEEFHSTMECEQCNEMVEKMSMENHKINTCQMRPITCEYCDLPQPLIDLYSHKKMCGSRTEICVKCQRHVMLSDLFKHEANQCRYPPHPSPTSVLPSIPTTSSSTLVGGNHQSSLGGVGVYPNLPSQLYSSTGSNSAYSDNFQQVMVPIAETPYYSKSADKPNHKQTKVNKTSRNIEYISQGIKNVGVSTTTTTTTSSSGTSTKNEEETLLPCEFCNKSFPLQILSSHQYTCRISPETLQDDIFLPCEFCSEVFPSDALVFHQASCNLAPANAISSSDEVDDESNPPTTTSSSSATAQTLEEAVVQEPILIPCEFCSEEFPIGMIEEHQSQCGNNYLPVVTDFNSTVPNLISPPPPLVETSAPRGRRGLNPTGMGDSSRTTTAMWTSSSNSPPATTTRSGLGGRTGPSGGGGGGAVHFSSSSSTSTTTPVSSNRGRAATRPRGTSNRSRHQPGAS